MAQINVVGDELRVQLDKKDKVAAMFQGRGVWALLFQGPAKWAEFFRGANKTASKNGYVRIPLSHVRTARKDTVQSVTPQGNRIGAGAYFPGFIVLGTYSYRNERTFWAVRNNSKAIIIELEGDYFTRLIVEVKEPLETVREIEEAVSRSQISR